MKTTSPLFTDTVKILYKKFLRYTPNGQGVYLYIIERKPNDIIEMNGDTNLASQGDIGTLSYTRKSKTSWDFKPISFQYIEQPKVHKYYKDQLDLIDFTLPLGDINFQFTCSKGNTNNISFNSESKQALIEKLNYITTY